VWHIMLALSQLFAGHPAEGKDAALRSLAIRPRWDPALQVLIACNGAMGNNAESIAAVRERRAQDAVASRLLAPFRANNPKWAADLDRANREAESLAR